MSVDCTECGKSFTPASLRKHKKRHQEPTIKCDDCPKRFHYQSEHRRHALKHSVIPRNVCEDCGLSFSTAFNLKRHQNMVHEKQKNYRCDTCDRSFSTKQVLFAHLMDHEGKKAYKCDVCNKEYMYRHNLTKHKCRPKLLLSHTCIVCKKTFKNKQYFKQHSLLHAEPKHQCHICGQLFRWRTSVRKHLKSCNQ